MAGVVTNTSFEMMLHETPRSTNYRTRTCAVVYVKAVAARYKFVCRQRSTTANRKMLARVCDEHRAVQNGLFVKPPCRYKRGRHVTTRKSQAHALESSQHSFITTRFCTVLLQKGRFVTARCSHKLWLASSDLRC